MGCRSLHSTSLALIDSADNWAINIDNGNINFTLLLDIKKAFDTIDHNILLQKLNHYGVANSELEFFRSYLNNRAQCCNVNGHNSTVRIIKYGVPQGSILGPRPLLLITEVTKSQRNRRRQRRLQIFLKNFTFEAWNIHVKQLIC